MSRTDEFRAIQQRPDAPDDWSSVLAAMNGAMTDEQRTAYNRARHRADEVASTVLRRLCLILDSDPLGIELIPATVKYAEELASMIQALPWAII